MIDINRIKTALEFLKDGVSFNVGTLRLGMIDKNNLYVTGWSRCSNIEDLKTEQALLELEEIRDLFKQMVAASQELNDFIQDKNIKFNLAYNYGMGAINICSIQNQILKWEIEIR